MQNAVPTATPGDTGIPLRIGERNVPLAAGNDKPEPRGSTLQTLGGPKLTSAATGTDRQRGGLRDLPLGDSLLYVRELRGGDGWDEFGLVGAVGRWWRQGLARVGQ